MSTEESNNREKIDYHDSRANRADKHSWVLLALSVVALPFVVLLPDHYSVYAIMWQLTALIL